MKKLHTKAMMVLLFGGLLAFASCGTKKNLGDNTPKKEGKDMELLQMYPKHQGDNTPKKEGKDMVSELSKRMELVVVEEENSIDRLELFSMEQDEGVAYYLSVGYLGMGDDFIQVYVDPFHELFIPLGSTLDEAETVLQQIKDFYKQPKGATMEIMGCFNKFIPDDDLETVTLTRNRVLLSNQIRFSIEREDKLRATFVERSSFNSLMSSLKFYRKMHPKKR